MNSVKLLNTKLIHRKLLHFYTLTNSESSEGEIKETIPFTIATKRIKYLGGKNSSKKTKPILQQL